MKSEFMDSDPESSGRTTGEAIRRERVAWHRCRKSGKQYERDAFHDSGHMSRALVQLPSTGNGDDGYSNVMSSVSGLARDPLSIKLSSKNRFLAPRS